MIDRIINTDMRKMTNDNITRKTYIVLVSEEKFQGEHFCQYLLKYRSLHLSMQADLYDLDDEQQEHYLPNIKLIIVKDYLCF